MSMGATNHNRNRRILQVGLITTEVIVKPPCYTVRVNRRAIIGVVIAALIAGAVLYKSRDTSATTVTTDESSVAGAGSPAAIEPPAVRPPQHVTKVSRVERQRLADRIAAAHAARAPDTARGAYSAPPRPTLPEQAGSHDLDRVGTHVLAAMQEAIPFLADCYEQTTPGGATSGAKAVARMTLTGDPDIGTVIDADQMFDENHKPLEPKLDACLRETMQMLQLPPLEEGDAIQIEYSFRF